MTSTAAWAEATEAARRMSQAFEDLGRSMGYTTEAFRRFGSIYSAAFPRTRAVPFKTNARRYGR